jgi:HEAT repeat protein
VNAPLPLLEALLALSVLLAVIGISTAVSKWIRVRRDRRRARLESAARPHLLEVLGDESDAPSIPQMSDAVAATFERLAISLLPKLRGADRATLVSVLEQRGALERARRRTSRPGAVGRANAAELLGAAGDASSLPYLVKLLDDRIPEVRIVAARALGKLGSAAVAPLLAALDGRRALPAGVVTMALVHSGAAGAHGLLLGLEPSRSARVRAVAVELVGQLGLLSASGDVVRALMQDRELPVRAAAARSLGRLALSDGVQPLTEALTANQATELRVAAADALGKIGGGAAVSALRSQLSSPQHELARAAAHALASCGASGVGALREAQVHAATAPYAREALARLDLRSSRRPQTLAA